MTWQVLIAFNIIFTSIATLLQKILMGDKETDPIATAILFQFMMIILVGIIVIITGKYDFSSMLLIIPNLIILMILIGSFYIFIFKSLKQIDASKFIVLLSARPLFTILASTFLLNEGLNPKQFIGVIAILSAVFLVTTEKFHLKFNRGELFALLAAALLGFANTNDRIALQSVELIPFLFLSAVLPGAFITFFNLKALKKIKIFFERQLMTRMILMSIFQFGAIITLLGALKVGNNSSQIVSISELNIVLTVILGIILLKERKNLFRKLAGVSLSFAGLLLIG